MMHSSGNGVPRALEPLALLAGLLERAQEEEERQAKQRQQQSQAQQPKPASSPKGGGGGGAAANAAASAAKIAAAREKNRLAQQRFRERQRAKQQEAGAQCEVLAKEIDQLELENAQLKRQNGMFERVLAVRDAMLSTLTALEPASQQEQQQQTAAAAAAAQGLARALEQLPSEAEMEDAVPAGGAPSTHHGSAPMEAEQEETVDQAEQQQQQADDGQCVSPSSGSCAQAGSPSCAQAGSPAAQQGQGRAQAPAPAPCQQPAEEAPQQAGSPAAHSALGGSGGPRPQSILGEPHRSGTSSHLDGSALQEVELIPPASNQRVLAKIAAMQGPEDLLEFFRQWQAELAAAYGAAEADGFGADSAAEVNEVMEKMTEMWWHVGQINPAWLSWLAYTTFPENSGQEPVWRDIAVEILPKLDEAGRSMIRRSWHNYSKRLAKAAVGVSRWVKALQECTAEFAGGLNGNAAQSLQLAEIASHIKAAVQEEYIASMELVAAQFPASDVLTRALVNVRAAPYLPDIVALVYTICCLDAEEREQRALAGGPAAPEALPADGPAACGDRQHGADGGS